MCNQLGNLCKLVLEPVRRDSQKGIKSNSSLHRAAEPLSITLARRALNKLKLIALLDFDLAKAGRSRPSDWAFSTDFCEPNGRLKINWPW